MISCKVISPQKTILYDKLRSVTVPAYFGQMQILPQHSESFVLLQKGNVVLEKSNKGEEMIEITGGECYIKNDLLIIIL